VIPLALFLIAFVVALWFSAPWWVILLFALGALLSVALADD
jgi:hypothetical protein